MKIKIFLINFKLKFQISLHNLILQGILQSREITIVFNLLSIDRHSLVFYRGTIDRGIIIIANFDLTRVILYWFYSFTILQ